MTFNDNADISGGKVSRRGRGGLIIGGGGGGLLIVGLIILSQVLGVDLTPLAGGGAGTGGSDNSSAESLARCTTGSQANTDLDCRMKGAAASLDTYWADEAPALGVAYHSPSFTLFSQQTNTGCGAASSATGPFYCPADEILYVDTGFFDDLKTIYGASGGSLAQLYVVAHEWGHHIQNLSGSLAGQSPATGPGSKSIRTELQADCFAGAWVRAASTVPDENGVPYLKPVTQAQISDALSAASAVGDDRIQASSGGGVHPESWTHGSSAQRQKWFSAGLTGGAEACDTFSASASSL